MYGKSLLITSLGALVGVTLAGGCAGGSLRSFGVKQALEAEPSLGATADAEPMARDSKEDREALRLAAVEDFLARTADYEWSADSRKTGTKPASATRPQDAASFARDDASGVDWRERSADVVPQSGTNYSQPVDRAVSARESVAANGRMSLPTRAPSRPRPALPTIVSVSVQREPVAMNNRSQASDALPSRVTNVALDVRPEAPSFSFDDWLTELEQRADHGRNLAAEWKLRLVELAIGRDVDADDLGSSLSRETRTLLSALYDTVQSVREVAANPLSTGDQALARADVLRATLTERADPVISTVALCRRVATFGVYDEMERDGLIAGREIQTIVYSEIENLRAEPTEDARFETRLSTRMELFSTAGVSMWMKEEPEIVDVCRRRRSDFFIAQRVALPPTIPAGDYVLKVAIEDRHAGRAAEYALPISIQAPISVARGR